MVETIVTTVISYVGTNIDDIFINTLFFTQADTPRQIRSVILGQYLGIGTLVVLSLLGAYGLQFVPQKYIGLLGLVPIALGIKEWLGYLKEKQNPDGEDTKSNPTSKGSLALNVMLVTMANGGDNIGVYIPLFASYTFLQMAIVVIIFALMILLWCFFSKKLADLPVLRSLLLRYKHIMVPVIFIVLGIYIIVKSNLF